MDYFKGMQCVDGPVCSRNHAEGKISELGIVKKWFDLDVTNGVKLLASLPLARWKMHSSVAMSMGIHNKL
jgi:hypothetical protein